MSDTPTSRFADLGFQLPPIEEEPEGNFPRVVRAGNRIYVSQMAPYATETPIPRLNMDANIDDPKEFDSLDDQHPLKLAMLGARLATLRSLAYAAQAAGGLDALSLCVRTQLAVRTGPNFSRLGMVYTPVNRILGTTFGTAPSYAMIGVAALAADVSMMLDAEYVTADG